MVQIDHKHCECPDFRPWRSEVL